MPVIRGPGYAAGCYKRFDTRANLVRIPVCGFHAEGWLTLKNASLAWTTGHAPALAAEDASKGDPGWLHQIGCSIFCP
jgi:hypothetical protein